MSKTNYAVGSKGFTFGDFNKLSDALDCARSNAFETCVKVHVLKETGTRSLTVASVEPSGVVHYFGD